ncbi:MAG TPA: helix-turn-helix domain-containing protein [Propionicimonas sp.]|jgi:AcrR family transcriptional regulator|uniref:TetR/AcrR family transcriptional regulator n=1 Tax=Propionicimonas sp. TaxID=1955623 RepID=UPI002F3EC698
MPAAHTPRNRGPAAAAANRAAILAAARRLFAEHGYRVPLNAIAREAGVGQAVLYRHFPRRLDLAYTVFADNFAELEELAAANPGPEAFVVLWRRIVDDLVESTAFIEMVLDARDDLPAEIDAPRLELLMAGPLARAQAAGLVDAAWTTADVLLLLHMTHGVVIAQPERSREAVRRAISLVDPRLA